MKFEGISKYITICLIVLLCTVWQFSDWLVFFDQPRIKKAHAATVFITVGTTWQVPYDWNDNDNTIEVIGGGGGGANGQGNQAISGAGGGGGAYATVSNIPLVPGGVVSIAIGTGGSAGATGGDTYVCNATTNCASINDTSVVVGSKGGGGASAGTPGTGGFASAGVGTGFNGGSGGAGIVGAGNAGGGGGGGGGAAGPNAAGNNGTQGTGTGTGGTGGQGDGTLGGSGGTAGTGGNPGTIGGTGGSGTEFGTAPNYGAGGGGGGGGGGDNPNRDGGNGGPSGAYGAGGGGGGSGGRNSTASSSGASGNAGLIVVTYTPLSPTLDVTASTSQSFNASLGVEFFSQTSSLTKFGATEISDHRDGGPGWTLNLSGTDWKTDTGIIQLDYDGSGSDENRGKLCSFPAAANIRAEQGLLTGVTLGSNDCFSDSINAIDMASATTGNGSGIYWITDMSLEQFIPANPTAAVYTTTLYLSIQ